MRLCEFYGSPFPADFLRRVLTGIHNDAVSDIKRAMEQSREAAGNEQALYQVKQLDRSIFKRNTFLK